MKTKLVMVKKILLFILAVLPVAAFAQTHATLYQMHRTVPLASEINPALMPDFRVNWVLPSPYMKFNAPLSLSDAFTFEGNTATLKDESIYNRLKDFNTLDVNSNTSLFHFGIRGAKSYFSVNVNLVGNASASISPDLAGWAFFGPADERNQGILDFSETGFEAMTYGEIGLNYARQINNKLTVGGRIKYLQGLVHFKTDLNAQLIMNEDSISLINNGMEFQSAGATFFVDPDPESFGFEQTYDGNVNEGMDFLTSPNRGLAFDIGATYMPLKNLTLSAALTDIGSIQWREYTSVFKTGKDTITTRGIEAENMDDFSSGMENYGEDLMEEVENSITLEEVEGKPYKTTLATKYYLGASYSLNKFNHVNALVHGYFKNGSINPALSLGYNLQLGRFLNTAVNWTLADGKFVNAGAGLSLNLLGLQVYVLSDNILTPLISLQQTHKMDVRFGLNFAMGYMRKGV
jgi:hypothetical protein